MPVVEQTDHIDIPDDEMRVDVYRSSGPGGQGVNTTDSAVRITHLPTGIVVSCQNERSQIQNRASAMAVCSPSCSSARRQEEQAKMDALKGDTAGSWGNQMRSYVLHPYQMVKDLRTEVETGNTGRGPRRRDRRVHRGRHPLAQADRLGRVRARIPPDGAFRLQRLHCRA